MPEKYKAHKQVLLIALLLIFIGKLPAQSTVTLSDGNFIYRLSTERLPEPHYKKGKKQPAQIGIVVGTVKCITVISEKDTNRKQVIIPGKNESSWPWTEDTKEEKFIIGDMNFDGNNDIRLLNSADNFTYYCWLYQPTTGQFVEDTALNKFVNPQFDQNQKLVYQNWGGLSDKGTKIYQFIDGKITLIEDEEISNNYTNKTSTVTIKKRVHGEMQVVKKEEIPLEN